MSPSDYAPRDAKAENTGPGNQTLHQGDGSQNVAIGTHSAQHNYHAQNYYNITLRSPTEIAQVFRGRDGKFDEPDRDLLIEWLLLQSSLNYVNHHRMLLAQIVPGTGQWVLLCEEFEKWKIACHHHPSRKLWMHGILGSGKTMIIALVIDHLQKNVCRNRLSACIYLYFQGSGETKPTLTDIFVNLLVQLLQQKSSEHVEDILKAQYQIWSRTRVFPSPSDFESMLQAEISTFGTVHLVIDALDDFEQEETRRRVVEIVNSLPSNVNTLITSRTGWLLGRELEADQELQIVPKADDIAKYVRSRISNDEVMRREVLLNTRNDIEQDIINSITTASKGIFLLTKFHMDFLCQHGSVNGIKYALTQLPESRHTAFEASIRQIQSRDERTNKLFERGLAKHALTWIIHAQKTLSVEEIKASFAIGDNEAHLNAKHIPSEVDWTSLCAGFVVLDPKTKVLRLVHASVSDYLLEREVIPRQFDLVMAQKCLTYLLHENCGSESNIGDRPLFEYASTYWVAHLRLAVQASKSTTELYNLAFEFLGSRDKVERAFQALTNTDGLRFAGMTGLHAAACFGLTELAKRLIDAGAVDVNAACSDNTTALHWAVQYNRPEMVELLLQCDAVDPNVQDAKRDTPLHIAVVWSMGNSDDIVRSLVKKKARIDIRGCKSWTSLSWAIMYGPQSTAKILIESLEDIDAEVCEGWSPMRQAMTYYDSERSDTALIDLLLTKGVDLNRPSIIDGWTPLGHAVQFKQETLISKLLRRHPAPADVNLRLSQTGSSPLRLALFHGLPRIARLLIEHGANVNEIFLSGVTPLIEAVKKKNHDTVWELLQSEVDINYADHQGKTALHHAVMAQDRSISWLLVTHNAGLSPRDELGCTVLDWAVERGDLSLAWLLCENGADINAVNDNGISVLHRASGLGNHRAVRFLLSRGAEKDLADGKGLKPLHHAVLKGHLEVVKQLAFGGANLNTPNSNGATGLHLAVMKGNISAMRMLVENGADLEVFDDYDRTPLMLAAELETDDLNVIVQLLCLGANVHQINAEGLTAWSFAEGATRAAARRRLDAAMA